MDFSWIYLSMLLVNVFNHSLLQRLRQITLVYTCKRVMLMLVTLFEQTFRNQTYCAVCCIACMVIVVVGVVI